MLLPIELKIIQVVLPPSPRSFAAGLLPLDILYFLILEIIWIFIAPLLHILELPLILAFKIGADYLIEQILPSSIALLL